MYATAIQLEGISLGVQLFNHGTGTLRTLKFMLDVVSAVDEGRYRFTMAAFDCRNMNFIYMVAAICP